MRRTKARTAAAGAAVFVLAGSASLALPEVARAETRSVPCGGTVTAEPGDHIVAVGPLGVRLDLGVVTSGVTTLVSGLCKVTVKVVEPVPVGGEPLADAVEGTTSTTADAVDGVAGALSSGTQPAPAAPGAGEPAPSGSPGGRSTSGEASRTGQGDQQSVPAPNSPVVGGAALPGSGWSTFGMPAAFGFGYGYGTPSTSALFTPAPGLRYGGQIPGYSPEFGLLGQDAGRDNGSGANPGAARALPATSGGVGDATGPAAILAVLALSGVTAALVRTWVLRRTAP
ncbi:hypothetical protein SacmaDRAFT_5741 [Saccharomonospora marina XMU15]|uniref:Uncharacterized protein n=1 Tax=Saccharomonospora marina XMU15 TaxID=882083 RepID=H5XC51_9PSEU|nr:hypothetical protein [Saccharomonospora marina]EHR53855.1 hypothetical protein SacmaDRAFT_5741 [Saccharomonospora marina XMU15]